MWACREPSPQCNFTDNKGNYGREGNRLTDKVFYDRFGDRDSYSYILRGDGIEVGISDFGAAIQYIKIKLPHSERNIVLGYDTISERLESGTYCGATIGRVANRIRNAEFDLNGKVYKITANEGKNCNHGGKGFDTRFFEVSREFPLTMTLESRDGDNGFPGNLKLDVQFTLEERTLNIKYTAICDKDTLWAPTCHTYFNFENTENALDSYLKVFAKKITLLDKEHIPTGKLLDVIGTPFDFTSFKRMNSDMDVENEQLIEAGGYDHNYVLEGNHAACVESSAGDLRMNIYTDLPGLQFYTANYLNGSGSGRVFQPRGAFCLEPQYFPNAANIPSFVSPILKAGEEKTKYIRYVFDF